MNSCFLPFFHYPCSSLYPSTIPSTWYAANDIKASDTISSQLLMDTNPNRPPIKTSAPAFTTTRIPIIHLRFSIFLPRKWRQFPRSINDSYQPAWKHLPFSFIQECYRHPASAIRQPNGWLVPRLHFFRWKCSNTSGPPYLCAE